VLSAPRVSRVAANQGYVASPTALATVQNHGYVARAAVPGTSQVRIARVAAPQVALPPVPEFTTDQLMLCLHLATKYLGDLLAAESAESAESPSESSAEAPVASEAVQLARATLATIDDTLVAMVVRAEAAANAALAPVAVAPAMPTVAVAASASIAPTPSVSHVAGRVVAARGYSMAGSRSQRNSAMAPRRTPRSASPLPPVIVKMDGQRAVVQNQAEIAQAKAALETQPTSETAAAPESTEG
jgi:hypothetical protein